MEVQKAQLYYYYYIIIIIIWSRRNEQICDKIFWGDCSSENICSLMKSVRFVGLFPVCAWLYFVNSVDLSSQTGCFFCWIHGGGGGGNGTTCWGPFLVAHFIEPKTLKLNKCNLVSSRWKERESKACCVD